MNKKDLKTFETFLKLALRRAGDKEKFLALADSVEIQGELKIDLYNRLLDIFTEIPMKIFPEENVRIKLMEDYRKIIQEATMELDFGSDLIVEETPEFDDIIDLFDLD